MSARLLALLACVLFSGVASATPQMLSLLPGPAAAASATARDAIRARGKPARFNAAQMLALSPRTEVELTLPDGSRHPYIFEFAESRPGGITTWVARHRDLGSAHRAIVTQGPAGAFGVFSTPDGEFRLLPSDGGDVLIDMDLEKASMPLIDLRGDALVPPASAKRSVATGQLPRAFIPVEGVNSGPVSKSAPSPIVEIDLMIVYSRAFADKLGANLGTRLAFLVARANTAFVDSEIAVRLRLVRTAMVDYPESASAQQALSAITPSCNGTTCSAPADPAFRDVETMRTRAGADMVAFLRGTSEFEGQGYAWIGSDPPWPGSTYSSVTGCVLGCEWVFIHELGHNLGVHHDRATVAQQAGGTSNYYGGAYAYSFGYAFCASGALTCNPYVPNSSPGGCTYYPECSTYSADNFGDLMSYFSGTTFRNYRFSNPSLRCAGSSGAENACGVVETDPKSANGALTINNMRAGIAALRGTVDPPAPQPSLLSFDPDAYLAPQSTPEVALTVARKDGTAGAVQVRYRTRDAGAIAGADYTAANGLLSWADGDSAPKQVRIPVVGQSAGAAKSFYVDLSEPSGTGEAYVGIPSTAVVAIVPPWPPNGAMPSGFTASGLSSAPWVVASDQSYESGYSLRSGQVFGLGSSPRTSEVAFSGQFADGDIVFAYRVSTFGVPRSAFRFAVDGIVQMEVGGETGWRVLRQHVAAGFHSLQWGVYNYDTSPCSGAPGAPGGTSCADGAWIDALALPLAAAAPASVSLASSPNPSAVGGVVTLTAQVTGARGTPTGAVSFREGSDTIPRCSAVTMEASGRAVCDTDVLAAGTHTLTAVYLGDANYASGPQASLTQTVNSGTRATQTITFAAPVDRSVDSGSFGLQASASSGLAVAFVSQTAAICTLSGATVKLRGVGTCTIQAQQAGDASYQPAPPVTRSFAVSAPSGNAADARGVPTYESVGLYWTDPAADANGCAVRFRRVGDSAWRDGLPLWFDAPGNECRGSLVQLAPDTAYEAELGLPGLPAVRRVTFRTWANLKPVAATINVPSGTATLDVTQGGSPTGYVVYQGAPGAVLDAGNATPYNITVNASYVIVRGFTLRGAQQDAIRIAPNVTDVVIEDNDVSGWGRQRSGAFGIDMDSAIRAVCVSPTLERVTIQRNRIHEPRYGANSWSDGHPEGPQAITFSHCGGNHVIRHNEISSTAGHYFNDIIGGEDNFSTTGFPNADSDVYGNLLSHAWDDAIEAEGGNRNVRVWGNYIDSTTTGIATALTSVGPFYAFRNVYNRNRELGSSPPDADARQELFKAGSDPSFPDGRRYFFHNTTLQARDAGATAPLGVAFGISGSGPAQPFNNTVSRNNIYHTWKDGEVVYRQAGSGNEFTRDMFNGVADVPVTDGIHAAPTYAAGNGWQDESGGHYALAAGTPGHDAAVRIANFNDDFLGAAPDVGASEAGAAPMRFGLAASPGSSVSASPGADLAVSQSASANPAATGKDVMFTVTARNTGPASATNVTVVDSLPAGWTFVWASPGCTAANGAVTCTVSTLANGAAASFKVVARAPAAGSATNTVTVSGAQFDPSTGNNASSVTLAINASPPGTPVIRYRLYSPVTQEHLFTTDKNEYDTLGAQSGTWNQEGQAGKVLNNPGTFNGVTAVPYYRLYNTASRWHHWTTDANEYYTLIQGPPFNAEGVDGYLLPTNTTGATQLYRLLYPDGRGLHHWTIDAVEYDQLITHYGWIGEGGSGFVIQ